MLSAIVRTMSAWSAAAIRYSTLLACSAHASEKTRASLVVAEPAEISSREVVLEFPGGAQTSKASDRGVALAGWAGGFHRSFGRL
jgi:hypothetical protein